MLHVGNERVPVCSGPTRRSFLQAGAAAMAGMSLSNILALEAAGAVDYDKTKIKNCITATSAASLNLDRQTCPVCIFASTFPCWLRRWTKWR